VKAHVGDIGNEMADVNAGKGCTATERAWDREEHPMELYGLMTGDQISRHGWNHAAQKEATEFYGDWTREGLRTPGQVQSTESLVKADRGREYLGFALTTKGEGLTDTDRRAMLQARSGCYPTASHTAKFKGKTQAGARCALCGGAIETFGHVQTGCRKLEAEHRTAHNMVAEAWLDAIQERCPHLEIARETTMGEWTGQNRPHLGMSRFKPDAFIRDRAAKRIGVWEFTRGMAEGEEGLIRREEEKRQAYHGVLVHLKHEYPDYQVEFLPVVMGILTSIRKPAVEGQLGWLGMKEGDEAGVGRAAAVASIKANGYVIRRWREMKGQLGRGGMGG